MPLSDTKLKWLSNNKKLNHSIPHNHSHTLSTTAGINSKNRFTLPPSTPALIYNNISCGAHNKYPLMKFLQNEYTIILDYQLAVVYKNQNRNKSSQLDYLWWY